jgi:hypothetical protein
MLGAIANMTTLALFLTDDHYRDIVAVIKDTFDYVPQSDIMRYSAQLCAVRAIAQAIAGMFHGVDAAPTYSFREIDLDYETNRLLLSIGVKGLAQYMKNHSGWNPTKQPMCTVLHSMTAGE